MSLGADRRTFTHMQALLVLHAEQLGYGIAGKWWYRPTDSDVGHKESLHHKSLAIDYDLYLADGTYLDSGNEHSELHDYWDSIGGNARIDKDMNHYSFGDYGGVR
ncbi:unnamed protein product [marine sediment metagenome]|uniref:Peptidase M15C domain-containing protein n=1 Tax=marine sediment metagenome TaxID=412755 RepID=X0SHW8_9ZZZZ